MGGRNYYRKVAQTDWCKKANALTDRIFLNQTKLPQDQKKKISSEDEYFTTFTNKARGFLSCILGAENETMDMKWVKERENFRDRLQISLLILSKF